MPLINSASRGVLPTFADYASLPQAAKDGAVAVTLDTNSLYVFDLTTMTWISQSSGQDNFSYNQVALSESITIPLGQQMIVFQKVENTGTIVNNGEIVVLEAS